MSDLPGHVVIGPFALGETLGHGGMGVVYRAEHQKTGLPVAMKFLSAYDRFGPPRSAFRREVQLVARLDHPGIVRVLDYGTVSETDVRDTSPIAVGDPWLAMEFAKHGSLNNIVADSWEDLRWVLLSVLDALAHAHARGVVHRDLKPGNILVAEEAGQRVVRLADFGIAHLRREMVDSTEFDGSSHESAGTPHYMAPEQIHGRWREYGAWTDLYALGCVAYRLATGMHVFRGDATFAILDQHIRSPPPPIRSLLALPSGFEAWVHRLLAKHPRERFRRAADAAWILRNMPAPDVSRSIAISPDVSIGGATMTLAQLGLGAADFSLALGVTLASDGQTAPLDELIVAAPSAVGGLVELVAPMPADWRMPERPTAAAAYFDVGLGLFGMRSVPVVGREKERDRLWALLTDARDRRHGHVVVLQGSAGSGKSALAQWLCERAHEVAGASVIRVIHDLEPTPLTGLIAAVERFTDCEGLSRPEVWARLRELMAGRCSDPGLRAAAMTELMHPTGGANDGVPPVVLASATERSIALRDGLSAILGARPLIIWLDDAHLPSAAESLEAMRAFVRPDSDLAVVVVPTIRAHENTNAEALQKLEPEWIEVPVVNKDEIMRLIRSILPVSDRAALAIADRAEGVPMFAFQLLADWVQSGRIVARDRGFEVDDLSHGGLPADIEHLWRSRLGSIIAEYAEPATGERVLRVAAALGRDVQNAELDAVTHVLGISRPADMVDPLIRHGLATPQRNGFSFVHAMLAETIVADAPDDEMRRIHGACADVLDETAMLGHQRLLRVARHCLEAERYERACDASFRTLSLSWGDDRAARMSEALAVVDRAISALALPPTDRRVVQAALWRARGFRVRWDFDEVKARAREIVITAAGDDLAMERAEALVELGLAEGYSKGELEKALPHFSAAATIFERLGAQKSLAEVLSRLAYVYTHMKRPAEAVDAAERCVALYRAVGDDDGLARGLMALAQALQNAGADGVVQVFEEAAELTERVGLRYWQANVLYGLATIDEHASRYPEAIARLRHSAKICAEIGSTAIDACRVNLACLLVLSRQWDEATSILREIEQRGTLAQLWRRARYALAAIVARSGDRDRVAELIAEIELEPVEDPTTNALLELATLD